MILGVLAALGTAFSWALATILFKRMTGRIQPLALNLVKSLLSVILLGGALLFAGPSELEARTLGLLLLSGLLGITLGDTLFFAALRLLDAHVLVLLTTIGQVLTIVLAMLLFTERPSLLEYLGIALVLLGVYLVASPAHSGGGQARSTRGLTLGLMAMGCMVAATLLAKQGLEQASPLQATFLRMAAGTAGLLLWATLGSKLRPALSPLADLRLLQAILPIVVLSTLGGFWLYHIAFKHLDASLATTLCALEPVFALPLARLVLRERITSRCWCGALLALVGTTCILSG